MPFSNSKPYAHGPHAERISGLPPGDDRSPLYLYTFVSVRESERNRRIDRNCRGGYVRYTLYSYNKREAAVCCRCCLPRHLKLVLLWHNITCPKSMRNTVVLLSPLLVAVWETLISISNSNSNSKHTSAGVSEPRECCFSLGSRCRVSSLLPVSTGRGSCTPHRACTEKANKRKQGWILCWRCFYSRQDHMKPSP